MWDHLHPNVAPTQIPSHWDAPSSSTHDVFAIASNSLGNANILCKGTIQDCKIDHQQINSADGTTLLCDASTANCVFECDQANDCQDTELQCINYNTCTCSGNCDNTLITYSQDRYIEVRNYKSTQDYYLTFILDNIDASACGDNIDNVQVLQQGSWRSFNDSYIEIHNGPHNNGQRYAFNYIAPVKFSDMFPISIVTLILFWLSICSCL